jgi:hypothetical protein
MPHVTTIDKAIPFHPFADKFPLLNGNEFNELVRDIEAHDQREPITLFQGKILDGRNRYRACLKLKREPRFREFKGDEAAARAFVFSQNIVRRHLKAKEKREAVAAFLKADPNKSDRQIAREVKASPTTVGAVRTEMEAKGDVSNLDTRIDTEGRKQPARKPRTADGLKSKKKAVISTGPAEAEPVCDPIVVPATTCTMPVDAGPEPAAAIRATPSTNNPSREALAKAAGGNTDSQIAMFLVEHELLHKFARFVISRTTITTDPKDHAEWKALLGRVKATLGIAS